MAGEGRLSTSLLLAARKDVDADLRRHDDVEATVAPRGALISWRILTPFIDVVKRLWMACPVIRRSADGTATSEKSMTVAEEVYEQAKLLPDALAQAALDFVLFLRAQPGTQEWRDLMNARPVALAAVWDNEEDEAWNDI
jgi:hypothetical protein